jgi:hypothetical protein
MQHQGATTIELNLLEVLRWNESSFCSPEATQRSVAISDAIEELQRLRALIKHAWIHDSYRNCGFDQMTSEQKDLYNKIVKSEG